MRNKGALLLLIGFLAIGAYGLITVKPMQEESYQALQAYPNARPVVPFTLTDHNGNAFTEAHLKGQWNLIFLGYTYCPDICPTTLAELRRIYPTITENEKVNVIFVSVDPKRDTTPQLKTYVEYFNPAFIGATAEHKVLFPFTRSLGMMYSIPMPDNDATDYLVNHSGSVMVVNPDGELVGRFAPEVIPGQIALPNGEDMISDLALLVKQSR